MSARRVIRIAALGALALPGCDGTAPAKPGTPAGPGWFTDITDQVGIDFVHDAGVDGSFFYPQMLGSGAALFDADGDGDLDVYFVNARPRDAEAPAAPNRLLLRSDDGTYQDVTAASGLGDTGFGMGVAIGDYDNDGRPDVYVLNYGPDALFRNEGEGRFTDVTAAAGIDNPDWACSASFFDYDVDGDLDLYVANYVRYPKLKVCADQAGRAEFCGPTSSPPTADRLYRNEGDGTFSDAGDEAGIASRQGRGLGVVCEDLDDDGWIDVYVANDGEANFLWHNNGDGTFSEAAAMLGAALNVFASTEASMGVVAGDPDGDGDPDLFMTHLARESNTFYRNDGTGSFEDRSAVVGLGGPSFPFTGFGTAFADLDHDGALDVPIANGRVKRGPVAPGAVADHPLARYAEPNLLFRNGGDGRFHDVSDRGGAFTAAVHVGRGLAVGDVDDDGDLDLLVVNCHDPARLYRNDGATGHWLIVRAVEPGLRRDAYGARIAVVAGGRRQVRTVNPGSSYASSHDPRAHFGLGPATVIDHLEVRWPDGTTERFSVEGVDRVLTISRGEGTT